MTRKPDGEDEEDLRAYANVFARLTPGSFSRKPKLHETVVVESRRRVIAIAKRLREAGVVYAGRLRDRRAALIRRVREHAVTAAGWRSAWWRADARSRRRLIALGDRLREAATLHAARLGDRRAALVRRVREHAATAAGWRSAWRRADARRLVPGPREPSVFVALASFAFAFGVAWYTGGPTDDVRDRSKTFIAEQAVPTVSATLPSPEAQPQPEALDVGLALRTPGVSEAAQLAVVDELAKDPTDDATRALLAGIDAESLYVSMACLRALSGRSCDRVASDLGRRLEDPSWQRRAWAARVLGGNACAGAGRLLAQRLAVEPDLRVQAQLQLAIDSLKEPGA
jgi:hypothetical protein